MTRNPPLRGQRLEYLVPQIGSGYRILAKESIGNWLGLTPQYPLEGTFTGHGTNKGYKFAKRAGFRYVSFKILLVPGTKITQPGKGQGKSSTVVMNTISIGFPRGKVGQHTAVHNIIAFAIKCSQSKSIMGIVTPAGRKYQWRGKLSSASAGSAGSGGSDSGGGGIPSIVGGAVADAAGAAAGAVGDAAAAAAAAATGAVGDAAAAAAAAAVGDVAGAIAAGAGLIF